MNTLMELINMNVPNQILNICQGPKYLGRILYDYKCVTKYAILTESAAIRYLLEEYDKHNETAVKLGPLDGS